jgi:3-oxoacyl-[acyl-carrier-protein] synthase III
MSRYTRIAGLGVHEPGVVVTNSEIAERLDTSDDWIRRRTGIVSRRAATAAESLVEMGRQAALRATVDAGADPHDTDLVIVATMSNTIPYPSVAARIAGALGLSAPGAFDISAACSGFSYGLELARSLIVAGTAGQALVIGVERMSDIVDPQDRTTAPIFGDGAGAVLVTRADEPGIWPAAWGSDGSKGDLLRQDVPWSEFRDRPGAPRPYLRMQGRDVFHWAVTEMPGVMRAALKNADIGERDLCALIPHQANDRITGLLVAAVDLPAGVVVARDIARRGNTSAASIPLAMDSVLRADPALRDGLALLIGFGAGLAYSAQIVRLPR